MLTFLLHVTVNRHADGQRLGDDVLRVVQNITVIERVTHGLRHARRSLHRIIPVLHAKHIQTYAVRVGQINDALRTGETVTFAITFQHVNTGIILHPEVDDTRVASPDFRTGGFSCADCPLADAMGEHGFTGTGLAVDGDTAEQLRRVEITVTSRIVLSEEDAIMRQYFRNGMQFLFHRHSLSDRGEHGAYDNRRKNQRGSLRTISRHALLMSSHAKTGLIIGIVRATVVRNRIISAWRLENIIPQRPILPTDEREDKKRNEKNRNECRKRKQPQQQVKHERHRSTGNLRSRNVNERNARQQHEEQEHDQRHSKQRKRDSETPSGMEQWENPIHHVSSCKTAHTPNHGQHFQQHADEQQTEFRTARMTGHVGYERADDLTNLLRKLSVTRSLTATETHTGAHRVGRSKFA